MNGRHVTIRQLDNECLSVHVDGVEYRDAVSVTLEPSGMLSVALRIHATTLEFVPFVRTEVPS